MPEPIHNFFCLSNHSLSFFELTSFAAINMKIYFDHRKYLLRHEFIMNLIHFTSKLSFLLTRFLLQIN